MTYSEIRIALKELNDDMIEVGKAKSLSADDRGSIGTLRFEVLKLVVKIKNK